MAKNNRDVSLVIRAKNEATKAIDSVSEALKVLSGAQDDAGTSAVKAGGLLGKLGTEARTLAREVESLSALQKVSGYIEKAAVSVERLQSTVAQSQGGIAQLSQEYEQAAQKVAKLTEESKSVAAAIAAQKEVVKSAKAEQNAANKAVEQAGARYADLYKSVKASKAPSEELRQSLRDQRDTLVSLIEKQLQAGEAYKQAAAAQAPLANSAQGIAASLKTAAASEADFAAALNKAGVNLTKQVADLDAAEAALAEMKAAATGAGTALGVAALGEKQLGDAAKKASEDLKVVNAALEKQSQIKVVTPTATGGGPAASATADYRAQRQAVDDTRKAYEAARAEATRLGQEVAKATEPNRDLQTAFLLAKAASQQAKDEYFAQGRALNALQASIQATSAAVRTQADAQQKAVALSRQKATADRESASAANDSAAAQRNQSAALDKLSEDTRKSLGLMQRLRGQILSLAAAYVGLYQVVGQIGSALDAFKGLEAAQSRLGAALGGDKQAVATELDFIRRASDRLGLSFQTLSEEYGKFAVSSQGTALEGEKTRKIFLAVANAARVNKLSTEQVQGTFKALTDIMSKGTVQAEELKGQLGDRLPGAFKIFADGIGVSTAKLGEMLKAGEVSSSSLSQFADELNRRFGGALNSSLETTTTLLGKFENAVNQGRIEFAKGGFTEGLNAGLKSLTEYLKSDEARQGIQNISAAIGKLIEIAAELPKHITFIVTAFSAFIGLRAGVALVTLAANMRLAAVAATAAGASFASMTAAANGSRVAALGAAAATGTLRLSLAALGGPIAVGLSVVAGILGWWLTRTEDATKAMGEHARILDTVRNAYDKAEGKAKDWSKAIEGVTLTQAQASVRDLRAVVDEQFDAMRKTANRFTATLAINPNVDKGVAKSITDIVAALDGLKAGTVTVEDFKKKVNDVAQATNNAAIKQYAVELLNSADKSKDAAKALSEMEKVVKVLGGSALESQTAMNELNGAGAESKNSFAVAADAAEKYRAALDGIKGKIPELTKELAKLKDIAEIDAFEKILRANAAQRTGNNPSAALSGLTAAEEELILKARVAVELKSFGLDPGTQQEKSFNLIKAKEGFQETAKFDVNAFRAGFGSDTVTLADGTIKKITEGMKVTQDDAARDLIRRIGEFQKIIQGQIGSERFSSFSADQQAALTSIAYNYGSLPKRIVEAVKSGSASTIATAVRGLKTDNGGINAGRREQEAKIIETSTTSDLLRFNFEEKRKEDERAQKARDEYNKSLNKSLDIQDAEAKYASARTQQAEIEYAVEKEQRKAQEVGVTLSAEQVERIKEHTRQTTNLKYEEQAIAKIKKDQADYEKSITDLTSQRANLEQLLADADAAGDTEKFTKIQAQLAAVNGLLFSAIQSQRAYWESVGGPEADAAIAKLDILQNKILSVNDKTNITGKDIDKAFGSSVTGAFDTLAQSLANGENALKSFGDFFRKVAADFLMQIAQMILQQALFNALAGASKSGTSTGGAFASIIGSMFHTGGVVGASAGQTRKVSPEWFTNAQRFHSGGLPGLKTNEVPAILKKGEEVLTEDDSRNVLNGGKSGGAANIKVVNAFDAGSFISEGLNSNVGEEALLNYVRGNQTTFKQALGL